MKPGTKNSYNSLSDIKIDDKIYKIFSLSKAEDNGLTYEMDCCLDVVSELQSKLESAFFECDQVFLDAIEDERFRREEDD